MLTKKSAETFAEMFIWRKKKKLMTKTIAEIFAGVFIWKRKTIWWQRILSRREVRLTWMHGKVVQSRKAGSE